MKYYIRSNTPLGVLGLWADDQGLCQVKKLAHEEENPPTFANDILLKAQSQLEEYFCGKRTAFSVPLSWNERATEFQKKVWSALQKIPFRSTHSYQQLAVKIGHEKACRAVGLANNKNPLPIFVPCHRVIGKDGSLTGFAWGIEAKKWLLKHEQKSSAF